MGDEDLLDELYMAWRDHRDNDAIKLLMDIRKAENEICARIAIRNAAWGTADEIRARFSDDPGPKHPPR